MKLRDSLYRIEKESDDKKSYTLRLLPESIIYAAHFPGMPVTPGVCIIKIADELTADYCGQSLKSVKVVNTKFLNVISPIDTPFVTYHIKKYSEDGDDVKVQIEVHDAKCVYSKLSLQYKKI